MGDLMQSWFKKRMHLLVKGAYDFVDVRDVAHGHILACDRGRTGEVYILSGWQIKVFELKKLVQDNLGHRVVSFTIPIPVAKFAARFMPFYYRLTKKTPKFTKYSLETLQSNSDVSNQKARRELGFNPRKLAITVKDTVAWFLRRKQKSGIR
jgi:dihydroflavonol-4-reductase